MAKLFRKVRQKFLGENKITKYLIYAVGEIILIVIGILIALQINTINQKKQRAKLEKVLLRQVRFEILEAYEDIWRDASNLELGNQSHYRINEFIAKDLPYTDSLCFDFYWINRDEYIYPTNAAYSRLKEVGLDIIKNDTIRVALQSLYEGIFPRITSNNASTPDISNVFNDYYLNAFRPNTDENLEFYFELEDDTVGSRVYTNVDYKYPKVANKAGYQNTIGYVPLNFDALKRDPKFQMLLEQTNRYRNIKMGHYFYVKTLIKGVIKIIENELGSIDDKKVNSL